MIYQCNRCGDHVRDLSGCVAHNVNDHKVTTLAYDDYAPLGSSRDRGDDTVGTPRSGKRPSDPAQLDLTELLTPETS